MPEKRKNNAVQHVHQCLTVDTTFAGPLTSVTLSFVPNLDCVDSGHFTLRGVDYYPILYLSMQYATLDSVYSVLINTHTLLTDCSRYFKVLLILILQYVAYDGHCQEEKKICANILSQIMTF